MSLRSCLVSLPLSECICCQYKHKQCRLPAFCEIIARFRFKYRHGKKEESVSPAQLIFYELIVSPILLYQKWKRLFCH